LSRNDLIYILIKTQQHRLPSRLFVCVFDRRTYMNNSSKQNFELLIVHWRLITSILWW